MFVHLLNPAGSVCMFQGIGGVSFTATKIANWNGPRAVDVLRFTNVVTNQGGAYNKSTGRFTAPYSGTYAFTASLTALNYPSTLFNVHLYVDGTETLRAATQFPTITGRWESVSLAGIIALKKGQSVWISPRDSDYTFAIGFNIFSGSLISTEP